MAKGGEVSTERVAQLEAVVACEGDLEEAKGGAEGKMAWVAAEKAEVALAKELKAEVGLVAAGKAEVGLAWEVRAAAGLARAWV